jgi:hypothetical protein
MPVGVTLINLRRDLRAETGQSLSIAQGVQSQATQDIQLDRQQRELWDAWAWPHLTYWLNGATIAGEALYNYPPSMPFDQIRRVLISSDGKSGWTPLAYGLNAYDVNDDLTTQGAPRRWGNMVTVTSGVTDPVGQMLLTPTPDAIYYLRFEGQAPCNPLIADTDKCVLDSKAIVLFAAAEILAFQKVEAAALKLTKAQNYLRKLLQNNGADKRTNYNMGGSSRSSGIDHFGARPYRNYAPGIDYIP